MKQTIRNALAKGFHPPSNEPLDKWAEKHFHLSASTSSRPGLISFADSEYQREILNTVADSATRMCVIEAAIQTIKTTLILIATAHDIVEDPAPIMNVQPTQSFASRFSKVRIKTMIEDNPELFKDLISIDKRGNGNSAKIKEFSNGAIFTVASGGSAIDLAGFPTKKLYIDEADRDVLSKEGDFIEEAKGRVDTYWDSRITIVSSPSTLSTSRIHPAFLAGDQRRWHVPCPHCGHEQELVWEQVKWNQETFDPKSARYECVQCHVLLTEGEKRLALRNGRWIPMNKHGKYPSFHASGLMSQFKTMEQLVDIWLQANYPIKNIAKIRAFVNQRLGKPWNNAVETVSDVNFMNRLGDYRTTDLTISNDIVMITSGIDVQKNRIEIQTLGFTVDNQVWVLRYHVIYGSVTKADTWDELKDYLKIKFKREDGVELSRDASCIDSRYLPDYVCAQTKKIPKLYAVQGNEGENRPYWPLAQTVKKTHSYFVIGDFTLKEKIFEMLRVDRASEDYIHFPGDIEEVTDYLVGGYFGQLSKSERIVTEYNRGQPKRRFFHDGTIPNEVLDTFKYALAARFSVSSKTLKARKERLDHKAEVPGQETQSDIINRENRPKKKVSGWLNGNRRSKVW